MYTRAKVFSCFDPTFFKVLTGMVPVTRKISLHFVQSIIILETLSMRKNSFQSKCLNSFTSIASHLWNTLPCNARIAGNVNTFRVVIDKLNLVPFIYC